MFNIDISNKESLLRCYRNELVHENLKVVDTGVRGLLQYRKNQNKRHPDTSLSNSETCWIAQKLYGIIPESQDTIFNCWNLVKIYDAIHSGSNVTRDSNAILVSIENGKEIIKHEHIVEFNKLANRQHCIANFMPAPKEFNGWNNDYGTHPGKGEYYKDNDFPDIYYQRAKEEFPDMFSWINSHMEEYCLQLFKAQITPWTNGNANFKTFSKRPTEDEVYAVVVTMNKLLDERAERLLKK
mgnify:CR=1 FL=1